VSAVFDRISHYADLLARIVCVPTTAGFFIILLLQVFFRYVLKSSLAWYTELIKIVFLWSLFLAFTIALKSGDHVTFKFLFDRLPRTVQKWLAFVCQFLALGFFIFMVWGGFKQFNFISPSIFEILGISEKWAVLSFPIAGIIMTIHTIDTIMKSLADMVTKPDTN